MIINVDVQERFHKLAQTVAGGHAPSMQNPVFEPVSSTKVISVINSSQSSLTNARVSVATLKSQCPLSDTSRLSQFSWSQCIGELQSKCPTLYQVLWTIVSRSDKRNRGDQHFPGMCAAIAILLKERNKHMTGQCSQTMPCRKRYVWVCVCVCVWCVCV